MIKKIIASGMVSLLIIIGFIGLSSMITVNVDAQGPTYVGGILSENTTWTIDKSPYIVKDNVLVEENINLTIQSGVQIKFNSDKYLQVDGTLFALGTEAMMISFTSNMTSPAFGDWGGIRFRNTCKSCILSYCIIKYGGGNNFGGGINNEANNLRITYSNIEKNSVSHHGGGIYNSGKITIEHCTISGNSAELLGGGIHNDDSAILIINDSRIINNNSSFHGGGISNDRSATTIIRNSIISNNSVYTDNRYGGGVFNQGSLIIKLSEIFNNVASGEGGGLYIGGSDGSSKIECSRIYGNSAISGGGIFYTASSTTIRNSDIIDNFATYGGGIYIREGEYLTIYNCNINNSNYNIYQAKRPEKQSYDTNASNNWWYTTDSDLINLNIHDYYDDFDLGKVLYLPLQTSQVNISKQLPKKPTIPDAPIGPTSCNIDLSYSYSTSATDLDNDKIKYGWDWDGDRAVDEWSNFRDPGTSDERRHSWSILGTYNVTVLAEDEFGEQSEWSNPLVVSITENNMEPDTNGDDETISNSNNVIFFLIIIVIIIIIILLHKRT